LAVFEAVEGKLMCLIFNLESDRQSYRKITFQNKKEGLDGQICHPRPSAIALRQLRKSALYYASRLPSAFESLKSSTSLPDGILVVLNSKIPTAADTLKGGKRHEKLRIRK
jgi:hypothetical protein